MTDWKTLAAARGLQLSDAELSKLSAVMDSLEPATRALTEHLTHDVHPAVTFAEEAVEIK